MKNKKKWVFNVIYLTILAVKINKYKDVCLNVCKNESIYHGRNQDLVNYRGQCPKKIKVFF